MATNSSQSLLNESNAQKATANDLFAKSSWKDAIETYDKALSTCPNYLDYEIAVLRSNVAACHLKLEDWKEAVNAATASLDRLEKLQGKDGENATNEEEPKAEEEADEEIISVGATKAEDKNGQPILKGAHLIEWASDIRGYMTFTTLDEIIANKNEIKRTVQEWLALT